VAGADERSPGDLAMEAARLDAVAARLETLGAALQRSIGETTESTASLTRSVGSVSAELGRLIGEAVDALGKTRKTLLTTDDAAGTVAAAFERIDERLATLVGGLSEAVERQRHLDEARPEPAAIGAAVAAEVATALDGLRERLTSQLDAVVTEVREEHAALAAQLAEERATLAERLAEERAALAERLAEDPAPTLTEDAVRAQVEAVVEPWISELRDELTRLVTEVHEDRAVLSRRLAGREDVEDLRELVETLAAHRDVVELQTVLEGLIVRSDVEEVAEELHARLESTIDTALESALAAQKPDTAPIERLRSDMQALGDDLATTAKRSAAGQRGVEELKKQLERDLPARLEQVVAASGGEVRRDTEALMAELHDDLALVMRHVVAGNQGLDQLLEAVGDLAARVEADEASTAAVGDVEHGGRAAEQLAPVVRAVGDDVLGAVGDLHEDVALVLKRLAAGQRELDDVREAILAVTGTAPDASVDTEAVALRLRDELSVPLAELGDDLSVLVRSVSGTQEELDALRTAVTDLAASVGGSVADAVAEAVAAAQGDVEFEDMEAADVAEGPDLVDLVEGLRADIDAGLGAAVSDLREELDSVRRLVAEQPEPMAAADVRAEVEALLVDVRDDLALLAQQLATGQDDVAGLRSDVLETLVTARDGGGSSNGDDTTAVAEAAAGVAAGVVADEIRAEVGALSEELRGQFDRLRQAVNRSRPDPAAPDLDHLGAEVTAEVTAVVEPVVAALHDELAAVAGQLDDARVAIEQLQAQVAAAPAAADGSADVEAAVADLHEDLAVVLGRIVAAHDDVRTVLDAVTDDDVRAVVSAVAAGQEDVRTVLEALLAGQEDVRTLVEAGAVAAEDLRAVIDAVGAEPEALHAILESVGVTQDDLRAVLDAVSAGQDDVRVLRDEVSVLLETVPAPPPPAPAGLDAADLEPLEIAIADLPQLMATELRAELETVTDELRAGLSQLHVLVESSADGGPSADTDLGGLRDDLQGIVNDLQTDLGTVIRELVSSQDEMSQLRAEVGAVADTVADTVAAALPPPPVEDPALAVEGMRVDLTAALADMAADLRADLEGLVAEIHEDLGALMSQVVAGHDDLDALRQQLADIASHPGAADQVGEDLDRLTRDLQALRERIPGAPSPSAAPARRRPRSHPQR
jgi:uncharacterized phage infection (PIP) family protein YhgE